MTHQVQTPGLSQGETESTSDWASQNRTHESVTRKSRMTLKSEVLMAKTAQANRVRHFELCFVEFVHSAAKLELGKSVFFPHTVVTSQEPSLQ